MNTADQLKRIKELLGAVTGFEDDDQQYVDDARDAVQKLIEALAEQPAQQEPVAWRVPNWGHGDDPWVYRDADDPVVGFDGNPSPNNQPLYAAPLEPSIVQGLTEEEIETIWKRVQANDFHDCVHPFAQAIEAKLRSKNEDRN